MHDESLPDWKTRLLSGYAAFRKGHYREQKDLYEMLGRKGQNPKIMLIGCSDSRVDPSYIFNAHPGEMFIVRNVANIVPPLDETDGYHGTSASIEYAVKFLGIEVIVVMGHEACGGVQACLEGIGQDPNGGYVGRWISLLDQVRERVSTRGVPADKLSYEMELETVRQSLMNLMSFPFVREAVESGRLSLQGAYFSIIRAELKLADEEGAFYKVEF